MMIIDYIRQIDWSESDNKKIAQELVEMLHKGTITYEQLDEIIRSLAS